MDEENQNLKLSTNGAFLNGNFYSHIEVTAPEATGTRARVGIVCVLDISGSMDTQATQGQSKQSDGFSRLDLVKHSVNTIVHSLEAGDYLSLVTFSSKARIELPLTNMNQAGVKNALGVVKKMKTEGSTNLWDGIKTGLEVSKNKICDNLNTYVVVLSDGEPNVHPPGGNLVALENYIKENPLSCSLNMFGYGYNLDTKLLSVMCQRGAGCYGYIPDCSMVGTIFVNFISNSLSAYSTLLTAEVKNKQGNFIMLNGTNTKNSLMGSIQYGCKRNLLVEFSDVHDGQQYAVLRLRYGKNLRQSEEIILKAENNGDLGALKTQYLRYKYINFLKNATDKATIMQQKEALQQMKELLKEMGTIAAENKDQYLLQLMKDMESEEDEQGQVGMSLKNQQWWKKWGKHYLPALKLAHSLEMCTNFKDPGIQRYGGQLFKKIENTIDTVFIKLEPPQPTIKKYDAQGNIHKVQNMSAYYNQCGGCIAGHCKVQMADGSRKNVRDIKVNDRVKTNKGESTVKCVLVTQVNDVIEMVEFKEGLTITNYHPVMYNGRWMFPIDIIPSSKMYVDKYFNFILHSGEALQVEGIMCAVLGHGLKGQVIEHEYLGTQSVIRDLSRVQGWNQGLIKIKKSMVRRDPQTNLIVSIHA